VLNGGIGLFFASVTIEDPLDYDRRRFGAALLVVAVASASAWVGGSLLRLWRRRRRRLHPAAG
jgi:hypothetical protein